MARLLALDVGEKRIGVAVSYGSMLLARPLTTIQRASKREDFDAIAELIATHDVERLIIGMPWTLRGEEGPQARRVQRYAAALSEAIDIPTTFQDESLSSVEAAQRLASAPRRKRRSKGDIDAAAAAVILQDYLNQLKSDD